MDETVADKPMDKAFRFATGVFIVVLTLAFYTGTGDPAGDMKRLLAIWGALGLGLWRLAVLWRSDEPRKKSLFGAVLLAFLALMTLASLRSEFHTIALLKTSRFFMYMVLYWVARQVYRTPLQMRRFVFMYCAGMALAACYGLMQKYGLDWVAWADKDSDVYAGLPSTFGHPNFASHALLPAMILGFWAFLETLRDFFAAETRAQRFSAARYALFYFVALALFAIHQHYTGQRAGFVAISGVVALVAVGWVTHRFVRVPAKAAVATLALMTVFGVVGAVGALAVFKLFTGVAMPLDTSIIVRYHSYVSAPDMALARADRILLGYGPGVYGIAYPEFWTTFEKEWFAQELRMNEHVHNDLMELSIDAGFFAAGLYLALLVLGMGYGLTMAFGASDSRRRTLGFALAGFFASFFIDGLFGFNFRVPVSATLFFLVLGMLEGIYTAERPGAFSFPWRKGVYVAAAFLMVFSAVAHTRIFAGEVELQAGSNAYNRHDYAAAEACYKRGERIVPWDDAFPRRLGQVYMATMRFDQAIRSLDASIALNRYYILTYLSLAQARMYVAQQALLETPRDVAKVLARLEAATSDLDALLRVCPMFPAAHELYGRISTIEALTLADVNDPSRASEVQAYWARAAQHLTEARKYDIVNKGESSLALAKVYMAQGDNRDAERELTAAMQYDPMNPEAATVLLDLEQVEHRFGVARNALTAQLRHIEANKENAAPENQASALVATHLLLANVLEKGLNNPAAAEKEYFAALEIAPDRLAIWTNFARFALDNTRLDQFNVAIAQTCGKLLSENKEPPPNVAALYKVLQKGLPALGNATEMLLAVVREYKASNSLSAAQAFGWSARLLLEYARSASPETPGLCTAFFNLGIVFSGLNELEPAESIFRLVNGCVEETFQPDLACHLADVLIRRERLADALDVLHVAHEKYPASLDVHHALARSLALAGDTAGAAAEYDLMLKREDLAPKAKEMFQRERAQL